MKNGVHIMNKKYNPKYKMICLKSPKSSEFAFFLYKQWSKTLSYIRLIMM